MVAHLPLINASLNFLSAVLLAVGYFFIRNGRVAQHRLCMFSAFIASVLFLAGYLTYHVKRGVVHYLGQGMIRRVYFAMLTSHTVLAIVIVPLVLRTLYLAIHERFDEHRRWARWTLPLWFYVSVTGVVIYEMLY
jgi:putative membrane protein